MAHWQKFSLVAAAFLVTVWAIPSPTAAEPPADLRSLLPAVDISKTLGQTFGAPEQTVAPRPFPDTNEGNGLQLSIQDPGQALVPNLCRFLTRAGD